jgi:hypothetical protein
MWIGSILEIEDIWIFHQCGSVSGKIDTLTPFEVRQKLTFGNNSTAFDERFQFTKLVLRLYTNAIIKHSINSFRKLMRRPTTIR